MRIDSVDTLSDYSALSLYLESLTPVVNSFLLSLESGQADFRLDIEGQRIQLIETIELDEKMMLIKPPGDKNELHYLWLQ